MLETILRGVVPAVLAVAAALAAERSTAHRGYFPPGFFVPWRRAAALTVLAAIFYLGLFLPLGMVGLEAPPIDPQVIGGPRLFLLQGLLLASLAAWFLLGYAGVARRPVAAAAGAGAAAELPRRRSADGGLSPAEALPDDDSSVAAAATTEDAADAAAAGPEPTAARPSLGLTFARQFGLTTRRPLFDLGLGLGAGAAGWGAVILLMVVVVVVITALGGEDNLPQQPPELVLAIAGLPWLLRAAIAATAGVVEELFFRGFLQPRVGILPSTALFVLAHLSYDQPFMLIGITALSLFFAFLVRWRRNVWAAIVAHAAFDAIQLLVVIPWVLRMMPDAAG